MHIYLHINSLVALRDLDGLPVASNLLPYFLMVRLSDVSVVLELLELFTAIVAADCSHKKNVNLIFVNMMTMYRKYRYKSVVSS